MNIKGNTVLGNLQQQATYLDDSGTADTYVVSFLPPIVGYTNGLQVTFKAANANTGPSTLNVNGFGQVQLVKEVVLPLVLGDILAGEIVEATYDGVNFQIERPVGTGGGGASGYTGYSGYSGFSGDNPGSSGFSGYSGDNPGSSGFSGYSAASPGFSGYSGYSGNQGVAGNSGFSGSGISGYSAYSGYSGYSGPQGPTGTSGYSGSGGGGSPTTADNGLIMSTLTNVQLGSPTPLGAPLLHTSYINAIGFQLIINGDNPTDPVFQVANDLAGYAIEGYNSGSSGAAIHALSTGTGATGLLTETTDNAGVSLRATAVGGLPGTFVSGASSTGTIKTVLELHRKSTGTPVNGIGGALDMYTNSSTNADVLSNQLASKWVNATHASRISQLDVTGVNAGSNNLIMSAYGTGVVGIGISSSYTGTRLEVVDNSLGANTMAYFHSTNTNAASNSQIGVLSTLTGSNASPSQTSYALYGQNAHGGTAAFNVGTLGSASGGSTNIGVYGVAGNNTASSFASCGVFGYAAISSYLGVYGQHEAGNGVMTAVKGEIVGTGNNGIGVDGTAGNATFGIGVRGGGPTGVLGTSTAIPVDAQNNSSSNNDEKTCLRVHRTTDTGGNFGANGIGGTIDFAIFTTDAGLGQAGDLTSNQLVSKWANATYNSQSSTFILRGVNGGTSQDWMTFSGAGLLRLNQYGAGTLTTDGSGNVTATSDERLKNIQRSYTAGIEEVKKINPIEYKWNEKSGFNQEDTYIGFSAQNIEESLGSTAVGKDSQGYLTIQDRVIIAALVNTVKEQQNQIDQLKQLVNNLK